MKEFNIKAIDDYSLSIHTFDILEPKAVIQLIHGMEEHQERYEDFAHFLNQNGYAVVTSDLRGHGKHAVILGHFCDRKGYLALIDDQVRIRQFISQKYPKLPVYLFAHSMGTIISRVLLQKHSMLYEKAVLSGYPSYQRNSIFGIPVTAILRLFRGADYKSAFVQNASVGIFNQSIEKPATELDWICKNPDTVQSYINDPYCGIGFTCSAFNDLYHLVIKMHQPKRYTNVNHDMPLLMLRGTEDPCTGNEKGAQDSIAVLSRAGFRQIERIDYPDMRHEILNEAGHQHVYEDILQFFNL